MFMFTYIVFLQLIKNRVIVTDSQLRDLPVALCISVLCSRIGRMN